MEPARLESIRVRVWASEVDIGVEGAGTNLVGAEDRRYDGISAENHQQCRLRCAP